MRSVIIFSELTATVRRKLGDKQALSPLIHLLIATFLARANTHLVNPIPRAPRRARSNCAHRGPDLSPGKLRDERV